MFGYGLFGPMILLSFFILDEVVIVALFMDEKSAS
jgi:hypothetical protein